MPRVAVIILVWNGMKFLKELLFSLQRMQQPAGGVSFLFVDNASTEGSAEYVRAHFPEAIIIENKENKMAIKKFIQRLFIGNKKTNKIGKIVGAKISLLKVSNIGKLKYNCNNLRK